MKTGLTISTLAHVALLLWGLISFAARPLEAKPTDGLPVDIISDLEFSQLTKGQKNAKVEQPKTQADKIGETKTAEQVAEKIKDKPEIKTASAEPPPPEAPPAEAKPDKKPPPKIDPIAETLKKEEAKKKAEEKAKAKAEQKKPQPPQPKFDPTQIAALLDKRDPQRRTSTGEALVPVPGIGTPTGSAAKLSQTEIDALRGRLMKLWNVPAGVQNPDELKVTVVISIGRDRKLSGPPRVLTSGTTPMFTAARDNAMRAVFMSQPFDMLKPEHYDLWKEIEITFDPRYMNGG